MTDDDLTAEELTAATGKRKAASQAAELARRGIAYVFTGRRVRVARSVAGLSAVCMCRGIYKPYRGGTIFASQTSILERHLRPPRRPPSGQGSSRQDRAAAHEEGDEVSDVMKELQSAADCAGLEMEFLELKQDAERYRWLREQSWFSSELCVLRDPKKALTSSKGLGADCPSHDRLDEAIDAELAAKEV